MIRQGAVSPACRRYMGTDWQSHVSITGMIACLGNGAAKEHAREMAGHESPRTTWFCDRGWEQLTQGEIERTRL